MNELIDIVDMHGSVTGQADKETAHKNGLLHRTAHIWIIRREREKLFLLFQLRGSSKSLFPSMLDASAAGHITAGEDCTGALRELKEELGLEAPFEKLFPLGQRIEYLKDDSINNIELCDVYFLEDDRDISEYTLALPELAGLYQICIEDIKTLFSDGRPAPAYGFRYEDGTAVFETISVDSSCFPFRIDAYIAKIAMYAEEYSRGKRSFLI